jgi:ubiquinone/menaquinone biosynthesis C-methylase UbiE
VTWDNIRSSYDAVAGEYEARFLDELDAKPGDRGLLSSFAAAAGDPVLEVGSGPGQVGAFVRHLGRRVCGLDLSPEMARLARRRLDAAGTGDMRSLPFGDATFGGLVAFYSLIHIQRSELDPVLLEFRRVLVPGGRVLFSAHEGTGELTIDEFLNEPVPMVATLFGLDELVAAGRRAGLEVLLAERRLPYASEHETVRLYVEARNPTPRGAPLGRVTSPLTRGVVSGG